MKKTMGKIIAENRKAKGMTQLELASKMGITDKAVSKWERDLSCPDISSIPLLAEVLEISVEDMIQNKNPNSCIDHDKIRSLIDTALKAVGVAMGIAVTVLTILNELEPSKSILMLGIGSIYLSITQLEKKTEA